jgi:D-alanyl-D-alanine carboxypeptidase
MKKIPPQKVFLLLVFIILLTGSFYFAKQLKGLEDRVAVLEPKTDSRKDCEIVDGEKHIYKNQCLPENYKPQALVKLSPRASFLTSSQYLDVRAKILTEELIADAEKDGMCLTVSSGYRSEAEQKKAVQKLAQTGQKIDYIAAPGRSEHQTGLAVDFAACPMKDGKRNDDIQRFELKKDFIDLPEYAWLVDNAYKYDFEQSYKKDNEEKTGYPEESWHFKLTAKK